MGAVNLAALAATEPTDRSTSARVVEAVADRRGVDPIELAPLYESVDPDALDALFRDGRSGGVVEFEFDGCVVAVTGEGSVDVAEAGRR